MTEPTVTTTYGQAEDCDVRITDDPYVSGRHARIVETLSGQVWLEDLGSTNGTWIGQRRVYREPLDDAAVFRIGRTEVIWRRT